MWIRRRFAVIAIPLVAACAMGTRGGRGFEEPGEGVGPRGIDQIPENAAPELPGPELEGPPDTATVDTLLGLTPEQATRYQAVRDTFMLATKPQRDSALARRDLMNARLDSGDRVAALFHAERLNRLGAWLKERQDAFEDELSSIFTSEQMQAYREWRKAQNARAKALAEEDSLRWIEAAVGNPRGSAARKTFVDAPNVVPLGVGSQAVRVGRTVYVAGQVAVDGTGDIVGAGDFAAQTEQAFANLKAVLAAADALPGDVVHLTVYVVDYDSGDLDVIRNAIAATFPGRHAPVTTVVGVESLAEVGLLIAVEAVAEQADSGLPLTPRQAPTPSRSH